MMLRFGCLCEGDYISSWLNTSSEDECQKLERLVSFLVNDLFEPIHGIIARSLLPVTVINLVLSLLRSAFIRGNLLDLQG